MSETVKAVKKRVSIRTSDRLSFRRCRRKFKLTSALGMFLEPISATPIQFWLGTGIHFALEDYHGHNRFGNPHFAFDAYLNATYSSNLRSEEISSAFELGHGMLDNYLDWLPGLKGFETLWVDGHPMCEVRLLLDMPELSDEYTDVQYSATIDRILTDEHGRIWILDYKTAKSVNTEKLPLDTQITSYYWAVKRQYGLEIEGMIYIQMLKAVPDEPNWLKSGKFSQAKNQSTTYAKYRKALIEKYGKIPEEYKEHLRFLRAESGFLDNKYVKVDFVRRNAAQIAAEERKIIAEAKEMLNPQTVMYPNPTKDCSWDCSFKHVCVAIDDGSDYKPMLREGFKMQTGVDDSWRSRIVWPTLNAPMSEEEAIAVGEDLLR